MANKSFHQAVEETLKTKGSVIRKEAEAQRALDNCIVAMENLSVHLANCDYSDANPCEECGRRGLSPAEAAKAMSYLSKVVSDTTRLLEFAKGNADQRGEIKGLEDLLKFLSHDQFQQVCAWIESREFESAKQLN